MRLVLTYFLTLGMGVVMAWGVAWIVGLLFPSARIGVFLVIAAWWLWTGIKYPAWLRRQR